MLYQVGLSRPAGGISTFAKQDFKRAELLYACLQAVKSALDVYFSIPVQNFRFFSMVTWAHMRNALVALQQLSVFDDPDWSLVYVHDTLDFLQVLEQSIEVMEKAAGSLNSDENPIFTHTVKKIRIIKAYCEERMAAHPASAQPGVPDYTDPKLFDDTWFQDVLGLFDYQYD
jgi:hypothetical protein